MEIGKLLTGVSYQDYHDFGLKNNALRSGHLPHLKRSPAHFKNYLENPPEETEALRQGKLIHSAFENPEKFLDSYMVEPEFTGKTLDGKESKNSKEAKQKRAEWRENVGKDKIILTSDEAVMITGILEAVAKHRITKNLLKDCVCEVSGFVKDPETGVMLQFRPDRIHKMGYVIDLKSTRDASIDYFTKEIFSHYGRFYILNAAHYVHCAKLMGISKANAYTFVAIEKTKPYALNVFALDENQIEVGERWRKKLTKLYADCLDKNTWPGYEERVINPAIPPWVDVPLDDDFYGDD